MVKYFEKIILNLHNYIFYRRGDSTSPGQKTNLREILSRWRS